MRVRFLLVSAAVAVLCGRTNVARAQTPVGTAFTYQGQLKQGGTPVNGTCDFEFSLWTLQAGGSPVGSTVFKPGEPLTNGLFTASLNEAAEFGPDAFNGDRRFLQIAVCCAAVCTAPDFTTLARQELTPSPYAMRAIAGGGGTGDGHSLDAADGDPMDAVFVDNAGNVGIGTTEPRAKLHVKGTTWTELTIETPANDPALQLTSDGSATNNDWTMRMDVSNADKLQFRYDNVAKVTVDTAGKVGIGTTEPATELHVKGDPATITLQGTDPASATQIRDGPVVLRINKNTAAGEALIDVNPRPRDGVGEARLRFFRETETTGAKRVFFHRGNNTTEVSALIGVDGSDSYFQMHGGNVGIGTTTPGAKLEVAGAIKSPLSGNLWFNDPNATGTPGGDAFRIRYDSQFFPDGPNRDALVFQKTDVNANNPDGGIVFTNEGMDGVEETAMVIRGSGRVGIGTTNPAAKLHVVGNDILSEDYASPAGLIGRRANGNSAAPTRVTTNDSLALIGGGGYDGAGFSPPEGYVEVFAAEPWTPTAHGTFMRFTTTTNGGTATSERMRITDDGNVEVGGDLKLSNGHLRLERDSATGYSQIGFAGSDLTLTNMNAGSISLYTHPTLLGSTKRVVIKPDGNVGIGSADPGGHRLRVSSSGGGSPGSTVLVKNTNTTNGIAMKLDNESTDVTLLVTNSSAVANGDLIRGDSWVGGWHPVFKVGGEGRVTCSVLEITGGGDLSEQFDVNPGSTTVEPGTVVCIDAKNPGELAVCGNAYDRTVAGVISGAGDVKPGMLMGQHGSVADGEHPVALTGRVYVWADASAGSIVPGDLLTTSDTPGHAMKVTDHTRSQGATLGKAMTRLESGKGLVLVLVSLQ